MKTNRPAFRCGCLILASALLGVSPAAVRGQETTAANTSAAVISSVAITQDPQRAAVRIEGAGKLEVHAARMQNPERLVLDFAGARLGVQKNSIPGVSAPVRSVRVGQFRPDTARVVIDLTASAPYQIAHESDAVVVYLESGSQPTDAPVVAPVSSAAVEKTPKENAFNSSAPRGSVHGHKVSNVAAPRFSLPNELTQPSLVLASFWEREEPVRPAASSQQAAQQAVQQANSAASTMAAQQGSTMSAPVTQAADGRYMGEPISVNLKDVDLKDFFRLIHEISGLNVVLDPNVK